MPVVPLTFRAIRLILDRDAALRASSSGEVVGSGDSSTAQSGMLPSSAVAALETALLGRWIGVDSYSVTLTPEDATTLVGWCREAAVASRSRDGAILRAAADFIEAVL
jgi:hypothetical protein